LFALKSSKELRESDFTVKIRETGFAMKTIKRLMRI
jgi:hypothetical protein